MRRFLILLILLGVIGVGAVELANRAWTETRAALAAETSS